MTRPDVRTPVPVLLTLDAVSREYALAGQAVHAVRGVSLDISEGDWLAVVGPSGCGKSTLLNLMGALDRPTSGRVSVDGRELGSLPESEATRFRLRTVGFVFQRFYLVPMLTARENIELPMAEAGIPGEERRRRARELLSYVGLEERERHRPSQLSGGEQQRVAVARALANRPRILLADEPTGELDATTGGEVIELIEKLNNEGMTVVVVTHDIELAAAARRIVAMRDGQIVADERRRPITRARSTPPELRLVRGDAS